MNNYLIPANSKKSQLILGYFTMIDIIIFGSGCGLTVLMLLIIRDASFWELIFILMPALITGLLVMPVLYYHNVLQLITNLITYISKPRIYKWKGWCVRDGSDEIK